MVSWRRSGRPWWRCRSCQRQCYSGKDDGGNAGSSNNGDARDSDLDTLACTEGRGHSWRDTFFVNSGEFLTRFSFSSYSPLWGKEQDVGAAQEREEEWDKPFSEKIQNPFLNKKKRNKGRQEDKKKERKKDRKKEERLQKYQSSGSWRGRRRNDFPYRWAAPRPSAYFAWEPLWCFFCCTIMNPVSMCSRFHWIYLFL